MITYFFHATLLLSAFTLFYWAVLRHETYFKLNRWVILGSVLFCLALPLVEIPASMSLWQDTPVPTESIIENIAQGPAQVFMNNTEHIQSDAVIESETNSTGGVDSRTFSWASILGLLYIIGLVIFLLVFFIQFIVLFTQRYNLNSFRTGDYTIVEMVKDAEPFSFLNYIYINPTKYDPETYDHIIEHEKVHIKQSHFVDKVIAELLVAVFWFNPFAWLLRQSISQNLEFLTDRSLLNKGIHKEKYQMSLLKVSVQNRPLNLTNSYNSSFLKNRINMMNAKNSSIVSAWKYLFILPLFVISVASLNAVNNGEGNSVALTEIQSIAPVNLPAGHVSRTLDLPLINKISLGMSGSLVLSYGEEQIITMTGPAALLDEISTTVVVDDWRIEYAKAGYREDSKQIVVYAQLTNLTHLALGGTGQIRTTNKFENLGGLFIALSGAGDLQFKGDATAVNTALSGTGNISIETNTTSTQTALSGTGNIMLSGAAQKTTIIGSGSGNISADKLQTEDVEVIIDGSSFASVHATHNLKVTAAGSAVINYKGNPTIVKDLKSESRLVRID